MSRHPHFLLNSFQFHFHSLWRAYKLKEELRTVFQSHCHFFARNATMQPPLDVALLRIHKRSRPASFFRSLIYILRLILSLYRAAPKISMEAINKYHALYLCIVFNKASNAIIIAAYLQFNIGFTLNIWL